MPIFTQRWIHKDDFQPNSLAAYNIVPTLFHMVAAPFQHDCTLPKFTWFRGRKQVTTKFSFSFCIWIMDTMVPNNLIPGEFAYIWQTDFE